MLMKNLIKKLFKDSPLDQPLVLEKSEIVAVECKHQWQLVAKTYAAPIRANGVPVTSEDPRVLFGVTTCVWHCSDCGVSYRDEILGSDEDKWEDIVDKVEKFGMQYIKVGTKVFAVAEWVPPLADGQ